MRLFTFITLLICAISAFAIEDRRYQINGTYYEFFDFEEGDAKAYLETAALASSIKNVVIDGVKYNGQLATFNSQDDMISLANADIDDGAWSRNWIGLTCDIDDNISNAKWIDGVDFDADTFYSYSIENSGQCAGAILGIFCYKDEFEGSIIEITDQFDNPYGGYVVEYVPAPVPEPSTYAAIFGAFALGFAAWRKRK